MLELGANDEQLDFPIVYTSAVNGYARLEPEDDGDMDMVPLLDAIVDHIPAPDCDADGPVAMQVCTDRLQRLRRPHRHRPRVLGDACTTASASSSIKNDGSRYEASVKQLFTFEALGRVEAEAAHAGDICAVVGVDDADIGDMFTSRIDPVTARRRSTSRSRRCRSSSPRPRARSSARRAAIVGGRQLKERLLREAESNISMRIAETRGQVAAWRSPAAACCTSPCSWRRCAARATSSRSAARRSSSRRRAAVTLEPIEQAVVDVPSEYAGKVIEIFGSRGGEMTDMVQRDEHVHLEFKIPSRGVMGLRTRILNATRGEATLFHHFVAVRSVPRRRRPGARTARSSR